MTPYVNLALLAIFPVLFYSEANVEVKEPLPFGFTYDAESNELTMLSKRYNPNSIRIKDDALDVEIIEKKKKSEGVDILVSSYSVKLDGDKTKLLSNHESESHKKSTKTILSIDPHKAQANSYMELVALSEQTKLEGNYEVKGELYKEWLDLARGMNCKLTDSPKISYSVEIEINKDSDNGMTGIEQIHSLAANIDFDAGGFVSLRTSIFLTTEKVTISMNYAPYCSSLTSLYEPTNNERKSGVFVVPFFINELSIKKAEIAPVMSELGLSISRFLQTSSPSTVSQFSKTISREIFDSEYEYFFEQS